MKKQKLTPWFPVNVKPARDGWYQVASTDGGCPFVLYWKQGNWHLSHFEKSHRALIQKRTWRGLANPPKDPS